MPGRQGLSDGNNLSTFLRRKQAEKLCFFCACAAALPGVRRGLDCAGRGSPVGGNVPLFPGSAFLFCRLLRFPRSAPLTAGGNPRLFRPVPPQGSAGSRAGKNREGLADRLSNGSGQIFLEFVCFFRASGSVFLFFRGFFPLEYFRERRNYCLQTPHLLV